MPYRLLTEPFRVPTTDGKRIDEHVGLAATGEPALSVAYMEAPPHWAEPFQRPAFSEVTLLVEGRKQIEIDEDGRIEAVTLWPGQSIVVGPGTRVRYSNPFAEPNRYVAVCWPAFAIDKAGREEV